MLSKRKFILYVFLLKKKLGKFMLFDSFLFCVALRRRFTNIFFFPILSLLNPKRFLSVQSAMHPLNKINSLYCTCNGHQQCLRTRLLLLCTSCSLLHTLTQRKHLPIKQNIVLREYPLVAVVVGDIFMGFRVCVYVALK